jgi:RHS repeat-associated protein
LNQPIAIWSPTYSGTSNFMWFGYDPLGRCVKRWVGESGDIYSNPATYYHYDGWNMLQEGNNAWGPARVYVHGTRVDEIVWSQNTFTGEQAYHHYDARGHCTLLTDSFAGILEQYEYDAFGQAYFFDSAGNSIGSYDQFNHWQGYSLFGNRFLFTGREWLPDLRLYDYRNRMYQPELGRFLQPDPIGFGGEAAKSLAYVLGFSRSEIPTLDYNLYRYCHNDPLNRVDPSGLLDLNLFPRGEKIQINGDKTPLSSDVLTVGGHGSPDSMIDSNGNDIEPSKLSNMIKENPKYDPNKPVKLESCQTGRDLHDGTVPFAQRLANELGSKVVAPTRDIFIDENGRVTLDTNGYYRTFSPQK